jgi:BirA family transcriptional regulator, biotin operon repressor / biotin---[acetyl-CoA-carboxylase] ligase
MPMPEVPFSGAPGAADLSGAIRGERLARWEGLTEKELQQCWGLPAVHLFRSIGSTNDAARELGAAGAAAGTVVLAEEQTAGRGRAGRGWSSVEGLGLWFSIAIRPAGEPAMSTLPIRAGLAIATALDAWTDHSSPQLKWPNDIILDGRKLGGILCEGSWNGGHLECVVVGVGLNLLHGADDFPPELRRTATSLRQATGRPISRFDVATAVLNNLRGLFTAPRRGPDPLLQDLRGRDSLRGAWIEVLEPETGSVLLRGQARGIDDDGALMVWSDGEVVLVRSGSVRQVTK